MQWPSVDVLQRNRRRGSGRAHCGSLGAQRERRRLLQAMAVTGLTLLAGCAAPQALRPPPKRVRHIGWLASRPPADPEREAFVGQLHKRGYVVGETLAVEYRTGPENTLPALAAELVRLGVEVIVAVATPATRAAKAATDTIPIVMMSSSLNLVSLGWAASLAQPGGNLTGFTNDIQGASLTQKQLSLLKDVLPDISRVAHLWDAQAFGPYPGGPAPVNRALSLQIHPLEVHGPQDLGEAFEQAARGHDEALLSVATPMLFGQRQRIAALALQRGLPSMFYFKEYVAAGGLMAYGTSSSSALYEQAADYVDRILRGTNPGNLPIQQPTTFDFVINLKTAQALGLTIPQHVLLQATEVIQ